jgi:hypothetical protein
VDSPRRPAFSEMNERFHGDLLDPEVKLTLVLG